MKLKIAMDVLLLLLVNTPINAQDKVSDGQWFHASLNVSSAHAMAMGAGITIALVDTGVDASHQDLSGSILSGVDLTSTSPDGRTDTDGHGTAMAGIMVAHGRVNGLAPQASVLPVRAGNGVSQVAHGVRWAVSNGAQVVAVSLATKVDDPLLRQEIQAALARDVVVVAGVGNRPQDEAVMYPAAIPGVVAVAGVDRNGNHSAVSVTGPEVVIAAPSDGISSTDKGGGYREGTGTSDATAIVAGAAALVRSKYPQLKATEVVRRLTATAIDKGQPGRDNEYGYGVLNLVGALTADLPAPTSAAATSNSPTPAPDPSTKDRFPWWLIALPAVIGAIVIGLILVRRRALPRR